jgi:hypothetical protein
MKINQLTQGQSRRVMYIENKDGLIEGIAARIGWVEFSKTGRTLYYRGRSLAAAKGGGVRGNFICEETGQEFWVSGIKKRGSNSHPSESVSIAIDEDAKEEYERIRRGS